MIFILGMFIIYFIIVNIKYINKGDINIIFYLTK
uniref:Uncharacterized protein n=1 Tax=viral metagenome TaxID=1070528 RepID=A0A6C0H8W3_9ZZZZ